MALVAVVAAVTSALRLVRVLLLPLASAGSAGCPPSTSDTRGDVSGVKNASSSLLLPLLASVARTGGRCGGFGRRNGGKGES